MLTGKKIFKMTAVAIAFLASAACISYYQMTKVSQNQEAVHRFYLPVLKQLTSVSQKWIFYKKNLEQDIQFHSYLSARDILQEDLQPLRLISAQGALMNEISEDNGKFHKVLGQTIDVLVKEAALIEKLNAFIKNKKFNEAATTFVAIRAENNDAIKNIQDLLRDFETKAASLQISVERDIQVLTQALIFLVCLCMIALAFISLQVRRWLTPLLEWKDVLSRLASSISHKGFTDLKSEVKIPEMHASIPKELGLLSQELKSMAMTAMEHEKTIQQQKTKMATLNGYLKEQNLKLRDLGILNERVLNSMSNALVVVNKDYFCEQFNENFSKFFNKKREGILGKNLFELLDSFEEITLREVFNTSETQKNTRMNTKDHKIYNVVVQPILYQDTTVKSKVVTFEDVTAIVQAEEKLSHISKIVLAGNLSSQVAHEIRNPLNSIMLHLEMLEDDLKEMPEAEKRIGQVKDQVCRLERFTEKYLGMGKDTLNDQENLKELDLNDLIEKTVEFASADIQSRGITINLQLHDSALLVKADADQMIQVLLNLLKNSIEALDLSDEGNRKIEIESGYLWDHSKNKKIFVKISDTGPGVASTIQEKIFEPFVTGKADGHGLGLSMAKKICLDHGGDLRHVSGSLFEVQLPC